VSSHLYVVYNELLSPGFAQSLGFLMGYNTDPTKGQLELCRILYLYSIRADVKFNGCMDETDVANRFADKFSAVYCDSSADVDAVSEYSNLYLLARLKISSVRVLFKECQ